MKELNVFFWGLICHASTDVAPNDAEVAALVIAPCHVPKIHFGPNENHILSSAVEVRFDHGTESGKYDPNEFNTFVPSLEKILGGRLVITPDVAVSFRYPKAEHGRPKLSVVDTYEYNADHISKSSHQKKRPNQPVARLLCLTVKLDRDVVIVRFRNRDGEDVAREVASDSCILVSNVESTHSFPTRKHLREARELLAEGSGDTPKNISGALRAIDAATYHFDQLEKDDCDRTINHFEYYSKLLAGADKAEAYEAGKGSILSFPAHDCDWVVKYVNTHSRYTPAGTRPECGNTNYP